MADNVIHLPVRDAVKHFTIKVKLTGVEVFGWRIKAGVALMTLGALVTGIRFEVEDNG